MVSPHNIQSFLKPTAAKINRYGMSAEWNNPESHTLFRNINNQEKNHRAPIKEVSEFR